MPTILHGRRISVAAFSVFVLALSLFSSGRARAQVSGATLFGTVTDPSGSAVPKAQITITDVATGVARLLVSDSAGYYSAPNLLPGNYEVTATAAGFSTLRRTGITLTVGAQQTLDISLQVGQVSQTVEVTAEAPTVQLGSSTLTAEVSDTTVRELPLNGRSWTDLGSLQAGVNQPNTQKPLTVAGRGQRGFGTQVSITGTRPDENLYRLDGVNINDYANNAPSNVLAGASGVDAIQEFTVLTGNAPAQYGRAAGGIFNAITRSGTNQFHGSVYEFLRNSALDARNFFDPAKIPEFRRNQFGASLGGPISKDNAFIFGDYEGLRQSLGVTQTGTTLSNTARAGTLNPGTPFPPGCVATGVPNQCQVTVDPNAAAFLAAFAPPANGAALNPDINKFTNSVVNASTANFATGRFDKKFSNKDSLNAVYSVDISQITLPNLPDVILQLFAVRRHSAALEETHFFSPQTANTVRLGYNRSIASVASTPTAIVPAAAGAAFAAIPGRDAVAASAPGLTALGGGLNSPPFYFFHYNSYQAYDDAFLTRGIHALKLGFSFERIQDNDGAAQGLDGTFTFKTLAALLQNQPFKFAGALATSASGERGIRESIFGTYIQDDIRLRSNLTVNAGLRYEFATVPTEVHNEITNVVPDTAATPTLGSPYFSNFTLRDFQPRLGFSWDPFKDGKTAVRGGFGVFDMLPLPYEFFLGNATTAPFYLQGSLTTSCPGPNCLNGTFTFPSPAYPLLLAGSSKGAFKYSYVQPDSKRRYIMEWNLNVQRQITPNLTMMVGYVGSRGLHLPQHQDDMNYVIPYLADGRYVFPYSGPTDQKLNPKIGTLVGEEMQNHSWYDALQVEVTRNLSHGLYVHGAYTWSRNLDYSSGTFAGDSFGNGETTQPWFDAKLWKGLSDFGITQNAIINGIWDLPSPYGGAGLAGHVLGGWELGGILKVNSGVPFPLVFGSGGDPAGVLGTDTTFLPPDRLTGPGCNTLVNPQNPTNYIKTQCFSVPAAPDMAFWTANCNPKPGGVAVSFPECFNLLGNAGRNIIIGPGLINLDSSVFKNNYIKKISENFNVQFRWEIFNILNRPNFSTPQSTSLFDNNGNSLASTILITTTQTPSRQMQVALKMIF
jgi:hypothetical protein